MSELIAATASAVSVAGSFLLLVPFFVYESIHRLIDGSDTRTSTLGIAVTASAIVLMPRLGWAKLRLGEQLGSGTTAGEGIQNSCVPRRTAALIALIGAGAGLGILDPIAALVIAAVAVRESAELWRDQPHACCAPDRLQRPRRRDSPATRVPLLLTRPEWVRWC